MYNRRKNKGNNFDGPEGRAAPVGSIVALPPGEQKNQGGDHHETTTNAANNNLLLALMLVIILATGVTGAFLLVVGTSTGNDGTHQEHSSPRQQTSAGQVLLRSGAGGGDHDLILKPPTSGGGEHVDMEAHLDDLLNSIGVVHKRLVDLGAAVRDNDPCFSLIDKGWSALLVDGDDTQPNKWKDRFPSGDYKGVVSYILADSIVSLLTSNGFEKDIGLLKIDIDSFDCFVMQALLDAGIRPKAIVMEVNVKFPPHVRFAMQPGFVKDDSSSPYSLTQISFDSEKRGHIYGCSLGYQVNDVMHPNDYEIYYMDWNNVMYVDTRGMSSETKEKLNHSDDNVKEWYDYGYWNRRERNKEFGFNKPISHWYEMDADGLLKEVKSRVMPLASHAHHHIQWNGKRYCFDQEGYLRSAVDDSSICSLTREKEVKE